MIINPRVHTIADFMAVAGLLSRERALCTIFRGLVALVLILALLFL